MSVPGKAEDITLSIDKDIQATLERYLKEGVIAHEAAVWWCCCNGCTNW